MGRRTSTEAPRFAAGDRIVLDLTELADQGEPVSACPLSALRLRRSRTGAIRHHGRRGTVVRGDETSPLQRLVQRIVGRSPVLVEVAWDDNGPGHYLAPLTLRSWVRHADLTGPERT